MLAVLVGGAAHQQTVLHQVHLGEGAGVQAGIGIQQLSLAGVSRVEHHGEGDVVSEGAGELGGELLSIPQGTGGGHHPLAAVRLKLCGHAGLIGLGHRPQGEGHGVGLQISGDDLRAIVRREGVLRPQNVLHLLGHGIQLARHGGREVVHRVGQGVILVLILVPQPVHPAVDPQQQA